MLFAAAMYLRRDGQLKSAKQLKFISESSVEISLQSFQSLQEVISTLSNNQLENIYLISKWGCDETSGQAEYKQLFQDETVTASSIFLITIAPIQLEVDNIDSSGKTIVWRDPTACSSRSCRPLKLLFAKETADLTSNLTKTEVNCINTQIEKLTWIRLFQYLFHVTYRFDICKWQIRSIEEKNKMEIKQKDRQEQFRKHSLTLTKIRQKSQA